MALSDSALSELLDALRVGSGTGRGGPEGGLQCRISCHLRLQRTRRPGNELPFSIYPSAASPSALPAALSVRKRPLHPAPCTAVDVPSWPSPLRSASASVRCTPPRVRPWMFLLGPPRCAQRPQASAAPRPVYGRGCSFLALPAPGGGMPPRLWEEVGRGATSASCVGQRVACGRARECGNAPRTDVDGRRSRAMPGRNHSGDTAATASCRGFVGTHHRSTDGASACSGSHSQSLIRNVASTSLRL